MNLKEAFADVEKILGRKPMNEEQKPVINAPDAESEKKEATEAPVQPVAEAPRLDMFVPKSAEEVRLENLEKGIVNNCQACAGEGLTADQTMRCPTCNGTGKA